MASEHTPYLERVRSFVASVVSDEDVFTMPPTSITGGGFMLSFPAQVVADIFRQFPAVR